MIQCFVDFSSGLWIGKQKSKLNSHFILYFVLWNFVLMRFKLMLLLFRQNILHLAWFCFEFMRNEYKHRLLGAEMRIIIALLGCCFKNLLEDQSSEIGTLEPKKSWGIDNKSGRSLKWHNSAAVVRLIIIDACCTAEARLSGVSWARWDSISWKTQRIIRHFWICLLKWERGLCSDNPLTNALDCLIELMISQTKSYKTVV